MVVQRGKEIEMSPVPIRMTFTDYLILSIDISRKKCGKDNFHFIENSLLGLF